MAGKKPQKLLLEVMAKLGEVRVKERFIPGDTVGEIVYGQYLSNGTVEINPVPAIVDTVIHECIHALHPDWSESSVKRMTTRLFHRLSEEELRTIYRVYARRRGYHRQL
jgi:hypothetical protein